MSQPVLDQAFRVSEANGVARYRAVTSGSEKGTCQYPDAGSTILGVTTHAQSRTDKSVGVRRLGIILCEASEAIPTGSPVIANSDGTIKPAPFASGSIGSSGSNNLIAFTSKVPGILGNSLTVAFALGVDGESNTSSISGNTITITAENDGGSNITSAADMIMFINEHEVLSTLIVAENGAGSNGSGLVSIDNAALSGGEASISAFATAQEAATQAGDLIEIFIH